MIQERETLEYVNSKKMGSRTWLHTKKEKGISHWFAKYLNTDNWGT